ncbi:GGDEF domain-containing protein [Pseudokineococcus sp. 1T1Z-3]
MAAPSPSARALVSAPVERLLLAEGSVVGVLHGSARPADAHATEGVDAVAALLSAALAADRRERAARAALEVAHALAEVDALTGLRNRRGWQHAVARAQERCRAGERAVIAVLDLDDLKGVNDAEGHLAGDDLLRAAARVISAACRPDDVAARTGGDEFAVLAIGAARTGASALERRLRRSLADAGVRATVAAEACTPGQDVLSTWATADVQMCARKRQRRAARP